MFGTNSSAKTFVERCPQAVKIGSVFDHAHIGAVCPPTDHMIDEGVGHHDNVIGAAIEESLDLLEQSDDQISLHGPHRHNGFGPEITHFQYKGNPKALRDPVPG
jgi:hypothetical protein